MRYRALACDYDGTLAGAGHVEATTLAALERLKQAGYRLVLLTGRRLDDLRPIFPAVRTFDRVVAENGALLFTPAADRIRMLTASPSPALVAELHRRGVSPLSIGRAIAATERPHELIVAQVIRDLDLDLHIIFNKGAVMVLPAGIDKASGLAAALGDLGVAPERAVGIGDAENDLTFLDACGLAVAVANALDSVKARANLVTEKPSGAGVVEVVERLVAGPGTLTGSADR